MVRNKYLVDNRKTSRKLFLVGEENGEAEHYKYLATVFNKNDMKFKDNLKQRTEKASHACGVVARIMKGGYNLCDTGKTLFNSQVRPVLLYDLEGLPDNPFALQSLDDMQVNLEGRC